MRIGLNSLTNEMIRTAQIISALDRNRHEYHQQVFGQEGIARLQMPGQPSHQVNRVEVEIDSENPADLQSLLTKIESVKGRLPVAVQHLKTPA